MDIEAEIASRFPKFSGWRKYQKRALEAVLEGFESHPYVILEAPGGSGKSLVAYASGLELSQGRFVYSVHTKQLQSQLMSDFPCSQLRGRSNFRCIRGPEIGLNATCWLCAGRLVDGKCHPDCPYQSHRRSALAGMYHGIPIVTNHACLVHECLVNPIHSSFCVIDEADLLWRVVRESSSIRVPEHVARTMSWSCFLGPGAEMFPPSREWLRDFISCGMADLREEIAEARKMEERLWALWCLRRMELVSELVPRMGDQDYLITASKGIEVLCLNPSRVASWILGTYPRILFTSATILDWRMFSSQLGMDPDDCIFIRIPPAMDYSRRPVIYSPVARVVRGAGAEDYGMLVEALDALLDIFLEFKGVVFTVSYALRDVVASRSRHSSRFITHSSEDREEAIERFKNAEGNWVLVSPSISRGVDFPYQQCVFVVLLKVPYPSLEDGFYRWLASSNPELYRLEAAREIVQAAGRGFRAPDDFCYVFILDSEFGKLVEDHPEWFPDHFKDNLWAIPPERLRNLAVGSMRKPRAPDPR